jgi:GT2 family glycosyltransferase
MFIKNKTLSTDLSTSIPQRRSVFAIFVHFGLSDTTNAAIESLLEGSVRPHHIIVVDHAETAFHTTLPATVIRPDSNAGYMGGLQTGISRALLLGASEKDLCILLNNDVLIAKNGLEVVLNWWKVYGGALVLAGSMGGRVSLLSGKAVVTSVRKMGSRWNVPYVHGSSIIGEFGLFTSFELPLPFFLYWEDVALSMMVLQRGGRLAAIPGFHTSHNDAEGPVSLGKLFYLVRNGAYVLERYTSLPWRVYWYGMNTFRRAYHIQLDGIKHVTVARALRDARASRLGKVEV